MKSLFVNHKEQRCGVYQLGRRFYELACSNPGDIVYYYIEVESRREFEVAYNEFQPDFIIYNWYPVTMPWLGEDWVTNHKQTKHFFIFHDGNVRQNFDLYLFNGAEGKDLSFPKEKTVILPRPLFVYDGEYSNNPTVTIGSFGFGGWQKGFTTLVEKVNQEFERATINIQMPFAFFGDRRGVETRKIADACRKLNTNSGITLNISHDFLSNYDTLRFLAGNDINVFLYRSQNQGLSSVIDYALSVKRPIAITDDSMFKHIYREEIDADKNSLTSIINRGTEPLSTFYEAWTTENFGREMEKIYESKQDTNGL